MRKPASDRFLMWNMTRVGCTVPSSPRYVTAESQTDGSVIPKATSTCPPSDPSMASDTLRPGAHDSD